MYSRERDAEATAFATSKEADANQYSRIQHAEGEYQVAIKEAEAAYITAEREAEAHFITQKKKAEGMIEMAKGYNALSEVLGGPAGLMQFLMIERGVYTQLAEANAGAIRGLQPKINVWNTGEDI